jgi:hypothetical protein
MHGLGGDMMIVAKMMDGRYVQVVKVADKVAFSEDRGWVCVCYDFETEERRRQQYRWMPATTRFHWVREFVG